MRDQHPDQPADSGDGNDHDGHDGGGGGGGGDDDKRRMYLRFGAMIGTSVFVMYLITYLNVFDISHVHFSEERVYMALTMGGAMGVVMMAWMWGMYASGKWNVGVVVASVLVAMVATFLSQSQILVGDPNYMRGMIPHHSIAILTSERANFTDVRVQELANEIIEAQRREIAEMEWLLNDIAENGEVTTAGEADARPVPSFPASP